MFDRYGADVLAPAKPASAARVTLPDDGMPRCASTSSIANNLNRIKASATPVPANRGLVVEEVGTGWVGAVTRVENVGGVRVVELEDRHGKIRRFPLGEGFSIDGQPVILQPPVPANKAPQPPQRTASGSRAVKLDRAKVAIGSRIWVEGKHDAELIEKVWGDDLRIEGVVVEELDGVDNLAAALAEFEPTMQRRVGVLVDHLLAGTKEQRLAEAAVSTVLPGSVIVLGHPYVDVWQAVKPERIGLKTWPVIERGTEWKLGILRHLDWPAETQTDIANAWKRILGSVRSYQDLEPSLLGRVEELIDFVTMPN